MTGFGRSAFSGKDFDAAIEASSVNRKNLEVSVNMPREWSAFEKDINELVKQQVLRGRLYLNITLANATDGSSLSVDDVAVADTLNKFRDLSDKSGIDFSPDLDFLLRIVQLTSQANELPDDDSVLNELLKAVGEAVTKLVEMRAVEGEKLKQDLHDRTCMLEKLLEELKPHTENTAPRYREMLTERLKQANLELDITDERVLREVAIFADRCDVTEEVTRLDSHISQFKDSINLDGMIGRKLDFICQELYREINTIGSKAGNVEVTKIVIEMKNELERIREQVQNVE